MAKRIEFIANVAIIVAAILLSAVLVKKYIINKPGASGSIEGQLQPGTKLYLSSIDWAKNGQTLVLAVSDKCHFCSESASFYQRLVRDHGNTRLVAVLPQPVQEGRMYLDSLNVAVDEVRRRR